MRIIHSHTNKHTHADTHTASVLSVPMPSVCNFAGSVHHAHHTSIHSHTCTHTHTPTFPEPGLPLQPPSQVAHAPYIHTCRLDIWCDHTHTHTHTRARTQTRTHKRARVRAQAAGPYSPSVIASPQCARTCPFQTRPPAEASQTPSWHCGCPPTPPSRHPHPHFPPSSLCAKNRLLLTAMAPCC